jgi:large subunit ribosomal protein L3
MHRGSMQFWHHRRAQKRLPRVRHAPQNFKEQVPLNILAYKVGMAHLMMVDDSEAPSKNLEISAPCTVLEIPQMEIYGARFYTKDINGYRKADMEIHHSEMSKKLKHKTTKQDESKLNAVKEHLNDFEEITALCVAYPKSVKVGQHHNVKFESAIGGSLDDKFNFISSKLGKEVKISDVFKPGEYVDLSSISKGKGWQGPIKRFGVARLAHKATQKVRHVGTHGAFTPGKVLFTVPQAGQMGFNYRTETNKRILKIGSSSEAAKINPKSGFTNYGNVSNDYILIKGSVAGPSKRLVRIRKSLRSAKGIKEPKINHISIND